MKKTITEKEIMLEALKIKREKTTLQILNNFAIDNNEIHLTDLDYHLQIKLKNANLKTGLYSNTQFKKIKKFELCLQLDDISEYPCMPDLIINHGIKINWDNLKNFRGFPQIDDSTRPVLSGIMFYKNMTVATNGHILRKYNCKNLIEKPFSIPFKYCNFIQYLHENLDWRSIKHKNGEVQIDFFNENFSGIFRTKIFDEWLPNIDRVLDKDFVGFNTGELPENFPIKEYKNLADSSNYQGIFKNGYIYIANENKVYKTGNKTIIDGAFNLAYLEIVISGAEKLKEPINIYQKSENKIYFQCGKVLYLTMAQKYDEDIMNNAAIEI